jgi:hypothetical protein
MSKKAKVTVAYSGIALCTFYLIVVAAFITTKLELFLSGMEVMTIISGIFIPFLIEVIVADTLSENSWWRHLTYIFTVCCLLLTVSTHFINLTVTNALIQTGINVPTYFQIGQWPSVGMAADYLAWGLFLGLAFISAAITISNIKKLRKMKITVLVCGILCLIGFVGPIVNNPNIWFIAVAGYSLGIIIISVQILRLNRQ